MGATESIMYISKSGKTGTILHLHQYSHRHFDNYSAVTLDIFSKHQ